MQSNRQAALGGSSSSYWQPEPQNSWFRFRDPLGVSRGFQVFSVTVHSFEPVVGTNLRRRGEKPSCADQSISSQPRLIKQGRPHPHQQERQESA